MALNAPVHLLAKSSSNPDAPSYHESFTGHIMDTVSAANHLVDQRGAILIASMGLGKERLPALKEAVARGAYLHDIGKANHQFQRLVSGRNRLPQAFRHEWVSTLLALKWEPLLGFREGGATEVRYASIFAASGHHLKFDSLELTPREGSGDSGIILFTGHPEVKELLRQGRTAGLPVSKLDSADLKVNLSDDPMSDVREWVRRSLLWWEGSDSETRRFVALVKALVVGADLVASASARHSDMQAWADSVLGRVCSRDELLQVAKKALGGRPVRAFQDHVANSTSRVAFVHAGCGTGKTVAAYLWAVNHANDRKIFFCYPTTGTATQGFADYAVDRSVAGSRLIHSRSEVDLEMLRESRGDEVDPLDMAIRYEALSAWDAPLVVTTADMVLGLIQNNRRGLFSLPAIGGGAFVFDEIHAYDERLFGALLRFIEAFPGAGILLMTASLQKERLRRIRQTLANQGANLEVIGGPQEFEDVKRYSVTSPTRDAPWKEVGEVLRDGGKVLWVANTVEGAREVWGAAKRLDVPRPLLYHSRYRYVDRVTRHNSVIGSFDGPGAGLAVTTQVCEVSLDISADMLVTDLAPVPSLIQRMGRVNRRAVGGRPKPVRIVEVDTPGPYATEELAAARRWLEELLEENGERPLSQADLAAKFESYGSGESTKRLDSSWIDGGPLSSPAPLREEGYTFSVIMGEDAERCTSGRDYVMSKELTKYSIPMPFWPVADEVRMWRRLNGTFVAPPGRMEYSEEEGGSWK